MNWGEIFAHQNQRINREIDTRLQEMIRRQYIPYVAKSRFVGDDDLISMEAARRLHCWYKRTPKS